MPSIAYLSFDIVPAPKGAAVHIEAFVRSLADQFGRVDLVTVSPTPAGQPEIERWPGVYHWALPAVGPTLIHRVLHFRTELLRWLEGRRFQVIHYRSIYEGFPLACQKHRYCDRLLFEVNGLPSIELKYRYPGVVDDRELLYKLKAQEQHCLETADAVLTPSRVTRDYLIGRNTPAEKIHVIPNGVDLGVFTPRLRGGDRPQEPLQLFYFGTLSAWQGVDLAIRALTLVQAHFAAELTVMGTATKGQRQAALRLAQKLGVAGQFHLQEPVSQRELVVWLHRSDVVLAPLTLNDRNLVQGCCPLKVLEAMAAGIPVITTDLPVVRELGQPDIHFLAVKSNSVQAIVAAIVRLRQEVGLATRLVEAARQQIEQHHTWQQAGERLVALYGA